MTNSLICNIHSQIYLSFSHVLDIMKSCVIFKEFIAFTKIKVMIFLL